MSSNLKVTNIKHESSSSNNLVLGSDGTTTTTLSSSANIKSAINASGSAPIYACRAWVNFNGTGDFSTNPGTAMIRGSGNVSSITGNATGDYTVNFTTAMPDSNYAVAASDIGNTTAYYSFPKAGANSALTTSSCRFHLPQIVGSNTSDQDIDTIHVLIFR